MSDEQTERPDAGAEYRRQFAGILNVMTAGSAYTGAAAGAAYEKLSAFVHAVEDHHLARLVRDMERVKLAQHAGEVMPPNLGRAEDVPEFAEEGGPRCDCWIHTTQGSTQCQRPPHEFGEHMIELSEPMRQGDLLGYSEGEFGEVVPPGGGYVAQMVIEPDAVPELAADGA